MKYKDNVTKMTIEPINHIQELAFKANKNRYEPIQDNKKPYSKGDKSKSYFISDEVTDKNMY